MFVVNAARVDGEVAESPDLVLRAQRGDSEAFGRLCRHHGTRLLRQATALCGDATLAEDLAQETLFEAWKSLRRYNGRCQFFTWLCAILLNRYRNALRQKRPLAAGALARHEREHVENILENQADAAAPPDQATALADRAALLRQGIDHLPPKQRDVIYLRFYADDSLEGIAAALGCSVGTVKSRLFHALERLRAMRGARGGFGELHSQ